VLEGVSLFGSEIGDSSNLETYFLLTLGGKGYLFLKRLGELVCLVGVTSKGLILSVTSGAAAA